jgi:Xaa-Pro dipeptidase
MDLVTGGTLAPLAELFPAHLAEISRRAALALAATGHEALLVHSGVPPRVFLDDQSYPFRAQAPFKAWVPLTQVPDCFLWFEPGRKPLLVYAHPENFWERAAPVPDAFWTAAFDLAVVPTRAAARAALPDDLSRTAFIGQSFPELRRFRVASVNDAALIEWLDFPRARKTPFEIGCLREASRLGARGHLAAARAFAEGACEYGIHQAFLEATALREQELPYNAIVALNEAGSVLHYQMLARQSPPARHSLLIDAGAEAHGYASDITRTYACADPDFAALIGQLDEVQQSLCASVRAGTDWRDVHLSAHRLIAELLRDAGIIRVDAAEALDTGLSSVFFPHGLGHLLGLQVHDVGGLMRGPGEGEIPRPEGHPALRLTRVLEPGFVVTVEPGIYFIDSLLEAARAGAFAKAIDWPRVEALRKFGGIRIEDDVVALEQGCENLTRDAFRQVSPAGS